MNNAVIFKKLLVQISMVSSSRILVKSESMHKLPIKWLKSCSKTSVTILNKSFNVCLLVVNGSKTDTQNFAGLHVAVYKAD